MSPAPVPSKKSVAKSLNVGEIAACCTKPKKVNKPTKKPLRKLNADKIIDLHVRAHAANPNIRELNADDIFKLDVNGLYFVLEFYDLDPKDDALKDRKLTSEELLNMHNRMQAKNPTVIRQLTADEIHDLCENHTYNL